MTTTDWKAFLKQHPIFSPLDDLEIGDILRSNVSSPKHVSAGETIVKQDDRDDSLYLIAAGVARVTYKDELGNSVYLGELRYNDYFGEIALLEHTPRKATVTATTDCELLELFGNGFRAFVSQHDDIRAQIALVSIQRLLHLNSVLAASHKQFENKLDLFEQKLEAHLKAADAQLVASRTTFDQINMRAHEVIESAERRGAARSRITGIGLSVLGLLASLGVIQYASLESRLNQVEEKRKQADVLLNDTIQKAKDIQNYNDLVKRINDAQPYVMRQVLLGVFDEYEQELDTAEAVTAGITILNLGDDKAKREYFDQLTKGIISIKKRPKYGPLLKIMLEQFQSSLFARDKVVIYCLYLSSLVLDRRDEEYEREFEVFKDYVQENWRYGLRAPVIAYFKPTVTALTYDIEAQKIPEGDKVRMKDKVNEIVLATGQS